jgi:branched-chain amino acid transport system substrate-binding protein
MRRSGARAVALMVAALASWAAGCGSSARPVRIGVVVDCVGINRSLREAQLAAAQLPFLERGARSRGRAVTAGISAARVAGRRVQLVDGCTEVLETSALMLEVRRLIEREHVVAVVAATSGPDEIALREVARRYPRVAFLPVVHGPREVVRHRAARNVFRFTGDYGQGVAGLGDYAYRRLGWRTAAIVLANWDAGWLSRDAFAAEFCSLGGRVVKPLELNGFDPAGADVAHVPRGVDGVAVFAPSFFVPQGFLRRLAAELPRPTRQLLVGPAVTDDPALLAATGRALAGVLGSSQVSAPEIRSYLRAYAQRFPGRPRDLALSPFVVGYRDGVEAVLGGLARAGGDPRRLLSGLARLRPVLTGGPVRLGADRQAVVRTSIVRIRPPGTVPVSSISGVDDSLGGLLPASLSPSDAGTACRTGRRPPPWAR